MNRIIVILIVMSFFGCVNNTTKAKQKSVKPEIVILDTDMGSDCDDVGALALLHEYANKGDTEILGVIYSSGAVPYGAGVIDAINRYYNHSDVPIGANYDTSFGD